MLNHIDIPANTLSTPDSVWPEANEFQIKTAIEQSAAWNTPGRQHQNFKVKPNGEAFDRIRYVCTGNNRHSVPVEPGTVLVYMLAGEPLRPSGQNPSWDVPKYKYDDSLDSVGHAWLRFIMDRDRSPWRYVLRHVTTLDPDQTYAQRCVIFQHIDQLPFDLVNHFMMAARWVHEKPDGLMMWHHLVTEHNVDPYVAYVIGIHMAVTGSSEGKWTTAYNGVNWEKKNLITIRYPYDHEAFCHGRQIFSNMREGKWFATPKPQATQLVSGEYHGKSVFMVEGQRKMSEGGYSTGFTTRGFDHHYLPHPEDIDLVFDKFHQYTSSLRAGEIGMEQVFNAISILEGSTVQPIKKEEFKGVAFEMAEEDYSDTPYGFGEDDDDNDDYWD